MMPVMEMHAAVVPAAQKNIHPVLQSLKIKDVQKILGRKLTLKEKISFLFLKKQLKKRTDEDIAKAGKTALGFGIAAITLLVLGILLSPLLILSLISAILAVVKGGQVAREDPKNSDARTGRILGWITLGLLLLLTILIVIVILAYAGGWV